MVDASIYSPTAFLSSVAELLRGDCKQSKPGDMNLSPTVLHCFETRTVYGLVPVTIGTES